MPFSSTSAITQSSNNNNNNTSTINSNNNNNNASSSKAVSNQQQQQQQNRQSIAASSTTSSSTSTTSVAANSNNMMKLPEGVERYTSFDDMPNLSLPLVRGIYSYGWENPACPQQLGIVPISRGGDVILQSPAGKGKSGAFIIGMFARINTAAQRTQALILEPTRELAQQVSEVVDGIGQYMFPDDQQYPCCLLSSGTRPVDDMKKLAQGVTVAVGTPGRVLQMLSKGALRADRLKMLVLDEADELLSQGFQEQIVQIFRFLPRDISISLISATFDEETQQLADKFLQNPTRILIPKEEVPVSAIKQFYVAVGADEKMTVIMDLYESLSVSQSIIFCNSRRSAEHIATTLTRNNFPVALSHSDLSRSERESVFTVFKNGAARVLVTTDLYGRGLDVVHVNIVINYELPLQEDKYIHRIGRGGRFGRKGIAINLLSDSDVPRMRSIEKKFNINVTELPMNFQAMLS